MLAFGCGFDESVTCPGHVGIRIKRADGRGDSRPLTRNNEDDLPDWSPGGRSIVFTRYPRGILPGNPPQARPPELWIYHRHDSRRLTAGETPAWSVRGEIAFERDYSIYVIRPDGSRLRRVAHGLDPQWSPSGRRLIYDANPGLYTVGRDGHGRRRLAGFGEQPDFSPDGSWVTFTTGLSNRIVVMRRNGTGRRTIFTTNGSVEADNPDWQSLGTRR
jgi:Tol biopolymer transport system component